MNLREISIEGIGSMAYMLDHSISHNLTTLLLLLNKSLSVREAIKKANEHTLIVADIDLRTFETNHVGLRSRLSFYKN